MECVSLGAPFSAIIQIGSTFPRANLHFVHPIAQPPIQYASRRQATASASGNGVGEFYAIDTINNKTILIRYQWTNLSTSTPHFEQLLGK